MSKSREQVREKELRKIKWCSDFDKAVIISNFMARKWSEGDEEDDGNTQLHSIEDQ